MRREWVFPRRDGLEGFGKTLAAFVEDVKRMTDEEKAALKTEVVGDAFVIFTE